MKKNLFLISSLALLAACSNEEMPEKMINQQDKKVIRFETGIATRTAETTLNNLKSFNVTAYHQENETETKKYISNVAVNLERGEWKSEDEYYWPASGVMRFYAYTPCTADIKYNLPDAAGTIPTPSFEYVVPRSYTEQKDILYSVTNHTIANLSSTTPDAEVVNLNFRHATSQIALNAKNVNSQLEVIIYGATLHNIHCKGVYTLPSVDTEKGGTARGAWTLNEDGAYLLDMPFVFTQKELNGISDAVLASTESENTLFLLPQQREVWDYVNDGSCAKKGSYFSISINVMKKNEDGTKSQLWPKVNNPAQIGAPGLVAIPAKVDWKEGKKYTYTLKFGEDGVGQIPPGQNDGGRPAGDDALKTIKYEITVDDMANNNL